MNSASLQADADRITAEFQAVDARERATQAELDRAQLSLNASAAGLLAAMLALVYGVLFATGTLLTAWDPLSTVILIQFVPVLTALAIIATFLWQRTGSYRPGGLLAGLLVTLYVVAGTATQA